jgi:formate/nitrite transporter FocA (FNT family)
MLPLSPFDRAPPDPPASPADPLDRLVEERAAALAQSQAFRWRFRLISVESVMMAALIIAAGITLNQPIPMVLRGALLVGAGCFGSGLILIGLTGAAGRLLTKIKACKPWRTR